MVEDLGDGFEEALFAVAGAACFGEERGEEGGKVGRGEV